MKSMRCLILFLFLCGLYQAQAESIGGIQCESLLKGEKLRPSDDVQTEMNQTMTRLIRGYGFKFITGSDQGPSSLWVAKQSGWYWECVIPLEFYHSPGSSLVRLKQLEQKLKLYKLMVIRNAIRPMAVISNETKMSISNPNIADKNSLIKWITDRKIRYGIDVSIDDSAFSGIPKVFGFSKGRDVLLRSSVLDDLDSEDLRSKVSREMMHAANFSRCKELGDCEKLIVFESPSIHLLTGQLLKSQMETRLKVHGEHLRTDEVEGYLLMAEMEAEPALKERRLRTARKIAEGQKVFLELALKYIQRGQVQWLDGKNYSAQVNIEIFGYSVNVKLPKLHGSQNRMDLFDSYRDLILKRLKHLKNLKVLSVY